MDTGTHITMGFGLAGLAHLDPAVQQDPVLASAVLLGAVIGSNAPDFDGLFRLKGNARYIKNHRGLSHSFPAVLLWGGGITALLALFFPAVSWGHLLFWTFLSVVIHVSIDLFNSYGTQMLRPISEKWIAFHVIHIFDPYIFISHMIGFILWASGISPGPLFAAIYGSIVLYLLLRILIRNSIHKKVQQVAGLKGNYTILPTVSLSQWGVVVETEDAWHVGDWKDKKLEWHDHFEKVAENEIIRKSKEDEKVAAFLYFTDFAHVQVRERDFGYEVRWFDLRYRTRSHYRFVALVCMDENLNILQSYTGWAYRPQTIEKKLQIENMA